MIALLTVAALGLPSSTEAQTRFEPVARVVFCTFETRSADDGFGKTHEIERSILIQRRCVNFCSWAKPQKFTVKAFPELDRRGCYYRMWFYPTGNKGMIRVKTRAVYQSYRLRLLPGGVLKARRRK